MHAHVQSGKRFTRLPLGVYVHAQLLMSAAPPHLSDYQCFTVTHVHSHSKAMYATAIESLSV